MHTISRYNPGMAEEWNDFVASSRNATFIFDRRYMDYHSDRFTDHSLVARDGKGRIAALLPACIDGGVLHSHRGLTWGGWLLPPKNTAVADMMEIWDGMIPLLREEGIGRISYKAIPHIYHSAPAEEDIFSIYRAGGSLGRVLISNAIDLRHPVPMSGSTRLNVNKSRRSGAVFGPSDDWEGFWRVLERLLSERYGTRPVHTLEEIRLLVSRFPDRIRLYTAEVEGCTEAGVVMYENPTACHSQYTAGTLLAKEMHLLYGLYAYIMESLAPRSLWLDLGSSNEADPQEVNPGLLHFKNCLGGRGIAYSTYSIPVTTF